MSTIRCLFLLKQARQNGEPVHVRHGDVENDKIGVETFDAFERFAAARERADQLHVRLLREPAADDMSYHGSIVHQHDPDPCRGGACRDSRKAHRFLLFRIAPRSNRGMRDQPFPQSRPTS